MKISLSVIVMLIFPCLTHSQSFSIQGKVRNQAGEPIDGVNVVIKGTTIGTVTNSSGAFNIYNLAANRYTLLFTHVGYRLHEQTITFPTQTELTIALEENVLGLPDIVVTATRAPAILSRSPVTTQVITSRDIQRSGAVSLTDLLNYEMPGVEFTSNAGVPNINMQGWDGNYILFLVDGNRMAGETHNNVDYNRINLGDVERIEIVKGPSSTLYGSTAIGGVINIITKKNASPFEGTISARHGSLKERNYTLRTGIKRKAFETLSNFRWQQTGSYSLESRDYQKYVYDDNSIVYATSLNQLNIDGSDQLNIEQKFTFRPDPNWTISASGGYFKRERHNSGAEGKKRRDWYYDYTGLIQADWALSDQHAFSFTTHVDRYEKYDYYVLLNDKERSYRDDLVNVRVQYAFTHGTTRTLTAGAEYLDQQLLTYMFDGGSRSAESFGLYIQDDMKLLSFLSLVPGIRYEYHSTYGSNATPKLSFMAHWKNWTFRTGYAAGYRSPSLKELYTDWDHLGMFQIKGNETLIPEKSHNVSGSAEYTLGWISLTSGVNVTQLKDKIGSTWNSTRDTLIYVNVDQATLKAFELNLRMVPQKNLMIKTGYAYTYDDAYLNGMNFSTTRPHSASLRMDYSILFKRITSTVSISGKYLSTVDVYALDDERDQYYHTRYPDYTVWKGNISCKGGPFLFTAGVSNIFNYKPAIADFYSGSMAGRTFFVGLTVEVDQFFHRDKKTTTTPEKRGG